MALNSFYLVFFLFSFALFLFRARKLVRYITLNIDIKKTACADAIPPKLIKIDADIIGELSKQAINSCLHQVLFPDNAKIVSAVAVDEGEPDKYDVLNYRSKSILSASYRKRKSNTSQCLILISISLLLYQHIEKVRALNRFLFVC